jgi:hypothetical protein
MSYFASTYFTESYFSPGIFIDDNNTIPIPELSSLVSGGSAFAELSFSEMPDLMIGIDGGSEVAIHFNKSFLTFLLEINTQQDHDLKINKQADFSLQR